MSCPMTVEAVERYRLTEKEVKAFCALGCSVECEKLFLNKFGGRHEDFYIRQDNRTAERGSC